ncbi:hypothetical protein RHSIM_Rhsim03G0123400 [Rhododendron simsii]|uniref:Transposase n=1 Tax=Rhododendron simsii TaxID=118357 RepID=A0A834H8S8_RHOSS|nr:hypothetical protein RHSIM_Rhsim03G0123400 [Rhododendron simsii]
MTLSKELSRDLHRNQTPSQESPETLVDVVPNSPTTNVAHTIESQKLKRKRGPTKLKTIAVNGGSRIEVEFDDNGQPIGDGSIKLSSFLGPLVREIVPYTLSDWRKLPSGLAAVLWQSIQVRFNLHEKWHREMCFQRMVEVWRASKSRLVTKVKNAPNEEARLKLQPDNVKSLHEWKDFVKEKTSATFKVKSEKFQEMRKTQLELQHTMSRKGYARLTAELKAKKLKTSRVAVWATGHRKKDGRPSNTTVAQKINDMEKIELDTQSSPSTNLKEDPLSKVMGPERNGRVRTFGKGVTKTKLTILSQMNGKVAEIREENAQCKSEIARMRNEIDELKKNQARNPATEGTPTTPIVSPSIRRGHHRRSEATPSTTAGDRLDRFRRRTALAANHPRARLQPPSLHITFTSFIIALSSLTLVQLKRRVQCLSSFRVMFYDACVAVLIASDLVPLYGCEEHVQEENELKKLVKDLDVHWMKNSTLIPL